MFTKIKDFLQKLKDKISLFIKQTRYFIEDLKKKFHNLYETNYNTGIYHLEHGNLWDASFRFKIIKRFWPNKLEAQYQYAKCLVLQNLNNDAKILLEEILNKDSNYLEAKDLLDKIINNETDLMVKEFNIKFNKDEIKEEKLDETNK